MPEICALIVNADDFGLSAGINRGIIEAHERGIVTSASLMVRWPGIAEAAEYARKQAELSVGLHIDMGEWVYVNDEWRMLYTVLPADAGELELDAEMRRQLAQFREAVGADPTHLDSHQHCHRDEPLQSSACRLAAELRVPLRHFTKGLSYCGSFYGQTGRGSPLPEAIGVDGMIETLATLPPGITELCCHPGRGVDFHSTYHTERAVEVATLCDPAVREYLRAKNVQLISFGEASRLLFPAPAEPGVDLTPINRG